MPNTGALGALVGCAGATGFAHSVRCTLYGVGPPSGNASDKVRATVGDPHVLVLVPRRWSFSFYSWSECEGLCTEPAIYPVARGKAASHRPS